MRVLNQNKNESARSKQKWVWQIKTKMRVLDQNKNESARSKQRWEC